MILLSTMRICKDWTKKLLGFFSITNACGLSLFDQNIAIFKGKSKSEVRSCVIMWSFWHLLWGKHLNSILVGTYKNKSYQLLNKTQNVQIHTLTYLGACSSPSIHGTLLYRWFYLCSKSTNCYKQIKLVLINSILEHAPHFPKTLPQTQNICMSIC